MSGGPDPQELQQEVIAARAGLDRLVGELNRRRHAMFDVRGQLRRHPLPMVLGGLAVAAGIGGTIALLVVHRRRRNAWPKRVQRLRRSVAAALRHPDRNHDEPSARYKIGVAGGAAAASVLAKAVATRLLRSLGHQ
ncbi:MAG TPA: hypothetical protein VMT03_00345 [Polyangia bacterium]|nr:hypothetical protein [Polyangia bacterium]